MCNPGICKIDAAAPAASSLGPLSALRRLTCLALHLGSDAALRTLPADLSALTALRRLSVRFCPLGDEGGWEHLASLPRLTRCCAALQALPRVQCCLLPAHAA